MLLLECMVSCPTKTPAVDSSRDIQDVFVRILVCTNPKASNNAGELILNAWYFAVSERRGGPFPARAKHLTPNFVFFIRAALREYVAIDETLFILLYMLFPSHLLFPTSSPPAGYAPLRIDSPEATSLARALRFVAASDASPQTRLIAFRLIGALLERMPELEHMHLLLDLLSAVFEPPIRVASVGLLKDAVLQVLSPSSQKDSLFASPKMLQMFGPIVLRPDPKHLFSSATWRPDVFLGISEAKRLLECLSFYHALLSHDTKNLVRGPPIDSAKRLTKRRSRRAFVILHR